MLYTDKTFAIIVFHNFSLFIVLNIFWPRITHRCVCCTIHLRKMDSLNTSLTITLCYYCLQFVLPVFYSQRALFSLSISETSTVQFWSSEGKYTLLYFLLFWKLMCFVHGVLTICRRTSFLSIQAFFFFLKSLPYSRWGIT